MKIELKFAFTSLKNLMHILNSSGNTARLIGGCVRDALLGIAPKDVDIATNLLPAQVTDLLNNHNIKVLPTGVKYGTVTAIIGDEQFEITTLRKDVSCDGRWAHVEFTDQFCQDAQRRDFTINALSYCLFSHQVYDYFDGLNDLKQQRVRFIGDAKLRIKEDYLRILRFFRFSSYYALQFDLSALQACIEYGDSLLLLSRQRINAELDKILLSPKALQALQAMGQGLVGNLFPGYSVDIEQLARAMALSSQLKVDLSLEQIYAIILSGNTCDNLRLLEFSNYRQQVIRKVKNFIQAPDDKIFAIKKIWSSQAEKLPSLSSKGQQYQGFIVIALLKGDIDLAQAQDLLSCLQNLALPKFSITGHDLKILGYHGKQIAQGLDDLRTIWISKDFQISKDELLKCLKKY